MYGNPRHFSPNRAQFIDYRAPHNNQRMPFNGPRAPLRPRNNFHNHRPQNYNNQIHNGIGNQEHWCETCDRGFPTELLLNNHKQQHQKCNIDGCQFIAHPKVITKHIQMQHSSGLYKKISKLNNPEEIDKWREERRNKYPTKVNIDKKAAELKEKIERGEKMGLGKKEWGRRNDDAGQGLKRGYNNNHNNQFDPKPKRPNRRNTAKKPKVLPTLEENRSLKPFSGIQSLVMDSDVDEDDNEDVPSHNLIADDDDLENTLEEVAPTANSEEPVVCGALSTLMCAYGSSDDGENEDSKEEQINKKIYEQGKDKAPNNKSFQVPKKDEEMNSISNRENWSKTSICNTSMDVQALPKQINTNSNDVRQNNKPAKGDSYRDQDEVSTHKNEIVYVESKATVPKSNVNRHINNVENGDDDSGPEEIKLEKNYEIVNVIPNPRSQETKHKVDFVKRKPIIRPYKPRMPSTLIYKLLSNEMKQERNKVLQCVRYIINNNYFDKTPE